MARAGDRKGQLKSIVERHRYLKAAPNFLTLCNSLCGFLAILVTLRAYELANADASGVEEVFAVSALVILFAMIFDALDGFVARLLDAGSMHGVQMDSLADMVTFGVAPATVVAIMTHSLRDPMNRPQEVLVYLLCSVYLGCAAIRLATYNVYAMQNKTGGDKFSGLPSPGAAAAVCSVVLFAENAKISTSALAAYLPFYAAFLGLLMVSTIPYLHVGKWLASVGRSRRKQLILLAVIVFLVFFRGTGALVLMTAYVLSGPVAVLAARLRRLPRGMQPKGA